jgi:hypothetical protein
LHRHAISRIPYAHATHPVTKQALLDELSRQFEDVLADTVQDARRQPPEEPELFFDRNCQCCFLRARSNPQPTSSRTSANHHMHPPTPSSRRSNWDVAAALAQMTASLQWRVKSRPWEVCVCRLRFWRQFELLLRAGEVRRLQRGRFDPHHEVRMIRLNAVAARWPTLQTGKSAGMPSDAR